MNKVFSLFRAFAVFICAFFCFISADADESIIMLPDNLYIQDKSFRYYSNVPTINRAASASSPFTRAIIVVHGTNRNAEEYFDFIRSAATNAKMASKTLILALRFFADDTDNLHSSIKEYFHYWRRNYQWKEGGLSGDLKNPISSFEVVNQVFVKVNANFPKVEDVVVTGYSSGGNFVQRYAALGNPPEGLSFRTRYVLVNTDSYMYMNSRRHSYAADCPGYDDYKYGLDNLPSHLSGEKRDIRKRFSDRDIFLLLGNKDIEPYYLDTTCKAEVQGRSRYDRGLKYYDNINSNYPGHNHVRSIVYDIGDDPREMYRSMQGINAIFHFISR